LEEAIERAKKEGRSESLMRTALQNLALLKEQDEDFVGARKVYNQMNAIWEAENDFERLIRTYYNIGDNYLVSGQLDSARIWLTKSYDLSQERNIIDPVESILKALEKLAEEEGNLMEALVRSKEILLLKDTLQNAEVFQRIGRMQEEYERALIEERERIAMARMQEQRDRENLLQYIGIAVFLAFVFLFVLFSGRLTISLNVLNGVTFFAFVLLFEFFLVLFDPKVEEISGGRPIIQLAINAGMALMLIPLHNYFEQRIRDRLAKKKLAREQKSKG
jgi:tetratricopeptide (TPR) repeat protein